MRGRFAIYMDALVAIEQSHVKVHIQGIDAKVFNKPIW